MNEPKQKEIIVQFPNDPREARAVNYITQSDEYIKSTKLRTQLLILYEKSKSFENKSMKLSYEDIAQMFNMSIESVKYHIFKARKENKGEIKSNGRFKRMD